MYPIISTFRAFCRCDPYIPERHVSEMIFLLLKSAQFHCLAWFHTLFRFIELAAGDVYICEAAFFKYRRMRSRDPVVIIAHGMKKKAGHDTVYRMDIFYIASAFFWSP